MGVNRLRPHIEELLKLHRLRGPDHPGSSHGRLVIRGAEEFTGGRYILEMEKNGHLVRIGQTAEKVKFAQPSQLSLWAVAVVNALPDIEILDSVTKKKMGHEISFSRS